MVTDTRLPRWELTNIYPSPTAAQFVEAVATLRTKLEEIGKSFDELGIGLADGPHPHVDPDQILTDWLSTSELSDLLDNYLYCWTTTDSNDDAAASAYGELDMITSRMTALRPRLATWLGSLDPASAANDSLLAQHRYQAERAKIDAQHVMSPELEDLAATLQSTGGNAWVRARDDSDASLKARIKRNGEEIVVALTELESDLTSPDRETRRKAAAAMDTAREAAAPHFASALNAIKGEALTLSTRRRWETPLDWSLHESAIDGEILDAMFAAAESVHGGLHTYLQIKARLLGLDQLAYYDLQAPLSASSKELSWEECASVTRSVLEPFSPRLSRVVSRAFDERWIDVEPREGKVSGGYCASVGPHGSRVLLNFVPAFPTVQTLAHELGHAHHNNCLSERTPLQQDTPMTLGETASMFCQRLVEEAVLEDAAADEQLAALDQILSEEVGLLLDLHARFHFEQEVFARRRTRTLAVDELTAMMLSAQKTAYGPGLDPDQIHKWQWVEKPHYYDTDFQFYNYPYQFGLLFALGLLSIYRNQPDGFAERYETLLSRTGMATAYELAQDFGIDIRDRAFWSGSADLIRGDVARFTQLAEAQLSA